MRLSTFIESNLEGILVEWDRFAATLFPDEDKLKQYLLRDHAREMLLELTAHMSSANGPQDQAEKSNGVVSPYHPDDSAASVHGVLRHSEGFTVSEVAAEFRALRSSVLRLWLPTISDMSKMVADDVLSFNESIDEALADSIITYRG